MSVPDKIQTWQMVQPWRKDKETGKAIEGILERTEIPMPEPGPGESLVEIAGCGVCHTDLGYFYDGVPTVNDPPLTLGHEISGTVIAGDLQGKDVIVPAVMPCNQCDICKSGRGNRCLNQRMPGNSLGRYGGFASHIVVPSRDLCVVEKTKGLPLSHFAVIADAVTTPYQAATRANLQKGDRAVVIGCGGGVGVYMTQHAKALGAQFVVGIDVDEPKLQRAGKFGADQTINARGKDAKEVKEAFRGICKSHHLPHNWGWTIFEMSGTRPGQAIGLELLAFVSKLIVVGFTTAKHEYSISRLMAFDAEMIGTWGCLPQHYPAVLEMVQSGRIQIEPFLETRPMSAIREAFEEAHSGQPMKRIVLEPDF
jgi:6-hydroxycyclohex-1-ene-1-carbonyl-CoA dehydrogenase